MMMITEYLANDERQRHGWLCLSKVHQPTEETLKVKEISLIAFVIRDIIDDKRLCRSNGMNQYLINP